LIAIETMLGTGIRGSCADLKTRLAVCLHESGSIQKGTSLPCSAIEGQLYYRTSDDQVFCYDGSAWDSVAGKVSSGFTNMQVFTSTGTWTKPSNVDKVYVKVVGGGGKGGVDNVNECGGGGGAGGYSEGLVSVTGNVTVTVGAGGTTGAGGTSSFAGSTTPQATGGSGGSTGGTKGAGGAGGVGSNGDVNLSGGAGGGSYRGSGYDDSGDGGDSVFGGGGKGGTFGGVGSAGATNTGGGGGGSNNYASGKTLGGSGIVIVYWNQ